MAPPMQARNNTVHVKPKSNAHMASEHGSCSEEIQTKSSPQRELLNDKLDNYLRVQGTRTKYMVTCMAVLLTVCISSSGVLVWHIVRTDKLNSALGERMNQLDTSATKKMEFIQGMVERNRMEHDCLDFLRYGLTTSGIYHIHPPGGPKIGNVVWCDMQTDGGGWIVIQRRQTGEVDFYRDWQTYKFGFGEPAGEFWIGNDVLHRLTSCSDVELRVDLWSWENETIYAEYIGFSIGDEDSNYILRIGNYTGGNACMYLGLHRYNINSIYIYSGFSLSQTLLSQIPTYIGCLLVQPVCIQ